MQKRKKIYPNNKPINYASYAIYIHTHTHTHTYIYIYIGVTCRINSLIYIYIYTHTQTHTLKLTIDNRNTAGRNYKELYVCKWDRMTLKSKTFYTLAFEFL